MGTHPIFESDFDCLTEFPKMPLEETIYSTSQISIPAELPDLLKQYTKAAIRTQPPDILQWSAAYFSSLANGDPLPVKRRLEPVVGTGLTVGNLDVLVQQHKGLDDKRVTKESIQNKWADLGLPMQQLDEILQAGNFDDEFNFDFFTGVACLNLGGSQISEALRLLCQLLTEDLSGYAERVSFNRFAEIYKFLADLGGIPPAQVELALQYLEAEAGKQGGMIMPRNMATSECPSLG